MDAVLRALAPHWFNNPPAIEEQLAAAEQAVGRVFPPDYRAFMAWSNGGEGDLKGGYFSPWPLDEIAILNEDYRITRYLPDFLAIGSDGGDYCYALDYRRCSSDPPLILVGFGSLDIEEVRIVGESFRRGIETLLGVAPVPSASSDIR